MAIAGSGSYKAISIEEYTNLLVFIAQLLRCNNSYIVNDAPAARLESGRKSCAIRYILFCQSPKSITRLAKRNWQGARVSKPGSVANYTSNGLLVLLAETAWITSGI